VPFREAHGIVAGMVRTALDAEKSLSELGDAELDGVPEAARDDLRAALAEGGTIESKVSAGGTSRPRLEQQLEQARGALAELRG
jgi:argininosuccinate lyase